MEPIPPPPPADAIRKRYSLGTGIQLQEHEDGSWSIVQVGTRWPIRLTRDEAAQLHLALNHTFGL